MGIFGVGVIVGLGGLAYAISRRPGSFLVARSALIDAPAARVFDLVNDFRRWRAWSPWEELDPALKRSYAGPDAGVGAIYAWEGNRKAGAGKMTIVQSTRAQHLEIQLEFLKPMRATHTATFEFEPTEGGVRVSWSMHGERDFMAKAFSMFVDMDKLIGTSFEQGLSKLAQSAKSADAAMPFVASA